VAELGDAPAPGPRNLGDKPAHVPAREQAGDARTLPPIGRTGPAEDALAEVAVAETVERGFAAQDRLEQPQGRRPRRG
jgi:hypothetical protein